MLSFSLLEEKRNYESHMTRSSIEPGDEVLIVLKTGLSVNDEFDTEIRATRKEIYDYGRSIKNAS